MVSNVFYCNQGNFPDIANDYRHVRKRVEGNQHESAEKSINPLSLTLETLPQYRRLTSIQDNINNGNVTTALGLAGLALINIPEDIRDVKNAARQIKCALTDKKFRPAYNYKKYQHEFSFYRGTLFHNLIDWLRKKNPDLAMRIVDSDKSLAMTDFGSKVLKALNVEEVDMHRTRIKEFFHTKEMPAYLYAIKYKGNGSFAKFGELTARAMSRVTLIGLGAMALFELPKIFKAAAKGDNFTEHEDNIIKQVAKSSLNVAITTAGVAYGGAIGAKKFANAGSLAGMAFGAIMGNYLSNKVQHCLD